MTIFNVDVRGLVGQHIAPGLFPATLTARTPGARDPANPAAGRPQTNTPHPCRAVDVQRMEDYFSGTLAIEADRAVLIVGATLPVGVVPKPGDLITLKGETMYIVNGGVHRDPDEATYICAAKLS